MSLSGKVIAISGRFSEPRNTLQSLITSNGGTFSSNVTKNVTHLIVADPNINTSKTIKARGAGIEVVGRSWLDAQLNQQLEPQSKQTVQTTLTPIQSKQTVQPLQGMVISLTGRLSKSKGEYAQIIAANGGTYTGTVTKMVTHVVAKDPDAPSNNLEKARKYGAKVVNEDLLLNLTLDVRDTHVQANTTKAKAPPKILLANKYKPDKHQVVGWWVSEKLDGVRAWWDGKAFWSRLGNMFYAPDWFKANMPDDRILDGELFLGRGRFQETISIVKSQDKSDRWKDITFMVFDIPSAGKQPFEKRIELMTQLCDGLSYVQVVQQSKVSEGDNIDNMLSEIEELGAEGLMLRAPKSLYIGKRSDTLLKVKSFKDDEGKVIGYATEGKGRLKGTIGSLLVETRGGKQFKVGSGLSDEQRHNPPKIGTIITYRYQELTNAGKPRFPTYVGIAIDKEFS